MHSSIPFAKRRNPRFSVHRVNNFHNGSITCVNQNHNLPACPVSNSSLSVCGVHIGTRSAVKNRNKLAFILFHYNNKNRL